MPCTHIVTSDAMRYVVVSKQEEKCKRVNLVGWTTEQISCDSRWLERVRMSPTIERRILFLSFPSLFLRHIRFDAEHIENAYAVAAISVGAFLSFSRTTITLIREKESQQECSFFSCVYLYIPFRYGAFLRFTWFIHSHQYMCTLDQLSDVVEFGPSRIWGAGADRHEEQNKICKKCVFCRTPDRFDVQFDEILS